jgi:hypothetical protein
VIEFTLLPQHDFAAPAVAAPGFRAGRFFPLRECPGVAAAAHDGRLHLHNSFSDISAGPHSHSSQRCVVMGVASKVEVWG